LGGVVVLWWVLVGLVGVAGVGLRLGGGVVLVLCFVGGGGGVLFCCVGLGGGVGGVVGLGFCLVGGVCFFLAVVTDGGVRIGVVEHIMSALFVCGIDGALIELSAPEISIMDGFSLSFIYLLRDAGVVGQEA
ncbi:UDP-3-O-acyl-N-acetylglucosamine deacetylase, partial [Neisseria sp. P0018.S001]|uniref:UDP-3-O-acyl-N-acetylglucosamine deacetylase n=1 Tax=Neisseria sp. P0018.S001 TaxID=3436787 RepID=UPI003F7F8ACB